MNLGRIAIGALAALVAVSGYAVASGRLDDTKEARASDDEITLRREELADEVQAVEDDDNTGDGDKTKGDDGTNGGNNTGDGDDTNGNDGTNGGNNTYTGDGDATNGDDGTSGGANTYTGDGDATAGDDGTNGGDNTDVSVQSAHSASGQSNSN